MNLYLFTEIFKIFIYLQRSFLFIHVLFLFSKKMYDFIYMALIA